MIVGVRRAQRAIALTCAAAALFLPAIARAWRTAADTAAFDDGVPVRWEASAVSISVHGGGTGTLDEGALLGATATAVATWSSIPCGSANIQLVGPGGSITPDDGHNTVQILATGWEARGFDVSAVGTTDIGYRRSAGGTWSIVEADIYLNDDSQILALADFGADGKDVHAVIVHELGHVLGMLHNCELDGGDAPVCDDAALESTMNPLYGGEAQLTLAPDDVAGFCFLYGRGCASTEDCARGECVDGTCVGCASSADCSETATCDDTGRCIEPGPVMPPAQIGTRQIADPCGDPTECASERCLNGACATPCEPARGCPGGGECTAVQRDLFACERPEGAFGASCDEGEGCQSSLCVFTNGAGSCTRECDAVDLCPIGALCQSIEGRSVCLAPVPAAGCSLPGAAPGRASEWWLGLVLVAAALQRASTRNRS